MGLWNQPRGVGGVEQDIIHQARTQLHTSLQTHGHEAQVKSKEHGSEMMKGEEGGGYRCCADKPGHTTWGGLMEPPVQRLGVRMECDLPAEEASTNYVVRHRDKTPKM